MPEAGYDPRCRCCPLLWSEVAMRAEYGDEPERVGRFLAEGFPLEIHEVDGDLDAAFAGTCQG